VKQLDTTLEEFCDKHWPCEYLYRGPPLRPIPANWDNMYLFQVYSDDLITARCVNVRIGHGTRGHQLPDGRFSDYGDYVSSFSVEQDREKFLNGIYFRLHHLMDQLSHETVAGEDQLDPASRIHREHIKLFFASDEEQRFIGFQRTKFCMSCLFERAYLTMSCGHSFCKECMKAYGKVRSNTVVELHECPITANSSRLGFSKSTPVFLWGHSRSVYVRPDDAGLRVLSLDE
jgi:hypothetical protein